MEPLKGGMLANPPKEARDILNWTPEKHSYVDWALQYLWNRPEISVVLSGMSSMSQVEENCTNASKSGIHTLSESENKAMKTLFGEDAILREAHEKYEKFTRDQELFYAALSREKFVRDQITREESAREEGIEQGIEKGRKEGFIQDKQIILKKQLSRKFQSSKNLLEQIVTCTNPEKLDLALEEILTAENVEEVLALLK